MQSHTENPLQKNIIEQAKRGDNTPLQYQRAPEIR